MREVVKVKTNKGVTKFVGSYKLDEHRDAEGVGGSDLIMTLAKSWVDIPTQVHSVVTPLEAVMRSIVLRVRRSSRILGMHNLNTCFELKKCFHQEYQQGLEELQSTGET